MKDIRIENIELKKTKYKDSSYEFVKWYPNSTYGKWDEMIGDGWIENGEFLTKDYFSYHKSCFEHPESCYVIAWLKKDNDGWYMETVGSRLLDLSIGERNTFFDIYKKADKKLNK